MKGTLSLREMQYSSRPPSLKLVGNWSRFRLNISPLLALTLLAFIGYGAVATTVHAADTIHHPELPRFDRIFSTSLPELLEWSRKPGLGATPPLPDPPPLTLGCLVPGCELVINSPQELEINLSGSLVEAITIEVSFEGLQSKHQLEVTGSARTLTQQKQFEITKGTSRFRGEALRGIPPPISSRRVFDAPMDPKSSLATPTVNFHLLFNKTALEKLQAEALTSGPPERELASIELVILAKRKDTTVRKFKAKYIVTYGCVTLCQEVDQIHLIDTPSPPSPPSGLTVADGHAPSPPSGLTVGNEAVVLANGLMKSTGWTKSAAFKGSVFVNMPDNVLLDDGNCVDDDPTDINADGMTRDPCWPEISVFTQNKGMDFLSGRGGPIGWTPGLGDKVPVKVTNSIVKVPVHFYVLWEHTTGTPPTGCTLTVTECLARNWLTEANQLYASMNSGIEFEIKTVTITPSQDQLLLQASCDVDAVDTNGNTILSLLQRHFSVDHYDTSGIHVYFVRNSVWRSPGGNIHANGWTCAIENPVYNDIIISTETAKATTLAHELGHALSLRDINDVDGDSNAPLAHACTSSHCLGKSNLMWSGSDSRTSITLGQSFRANVNRESAVHRNISTGTVLRGEPRVCMDELDWHACPKLTLDR